MKKRKDTILKSKYFWGIFAVSFIALCLIGEIVLAIVNDVITKGQPIALTLPLYIMPFVALTFTLLLLYSIRRNNARSQKLIDSMNKIAEGDLSVRIYPEKHDKKFQKLYDNFNKMAEELSSVSALKDDFIHTFSHELKTPLSSVNGFANLLLDGGLSEEERTKVTKIIADESARLLNLVGNTLTLSRFENQNISDVTEEIKLDKQIRECIVSMQREWDKKKITVTTDLQPVTVRGVSDWLLHIWTNLLGNAIKFTPDGGEISVSLVSDGEYAAVKISDTGAGIPEDEISKIFDKYYRASNTVGTEGSGLGLAVCKRILNLCGGEISAESEVGKGSTFTVKLPL